MHQFNDDFRKTSVLRVHAGQDVKAPDHGGSSTSMRRQTTRVSGRKCSPEGGGTSKLRRSGAEIFRYACAFSTRLNSARRRKRAWIRTSDNTRADVVRVIAPPVRRCRAADGMRNAVDKSTASNFGEGRVTRLRTAMSAHDMSRRSARIDCRCRAGSLSRNPFMKARQYRISPAVGRGAESVAVAVVRATQEGRREGVVGTTR